jgi:hypothetical protein
MGTKNQECGWHEDLSGVSFIRSEEDEPYHIELSRLADLREAHDYFGIKLTNISDWVIHLTEKAWIEKRHLSELAYIIQKREPRNNIDWVQTFWYIKMTSNLDQLWEEMEKKGELESLDDDVMIGDDDGAKMMRNVEKFTHAAINYVKEHGWAGVPD